MRIKALAALLTASLFIPVGPVYSASLPAADVKTFGALPNDGIDDTYAIQRAIDSLPDTGGTVVMAPGEYLLNVNQPMDHALVIRKNGVKIMGKGVVLKAANTMAGMLKIGGNNAVISSTLSSSLEKSDISFDGSQKANTGILIGSSNVSIKNTQIKNISQPQNAQDPLYNLAPSGVKVVGNIKNIKLNLMDIQNIKAINTSGASSGHKVSRGVWVLTTPTTAIPKSVSITNSSFFEIGPKDDGDCIVFQNSNEDAGANITGNTFNRCYKRAIHLQASGVTVSGNTINNSFLNDNFYETYSIPKQEDVSDMYAAISAYGNSITISNNKISGTGGFYRTIEAALDESLANKNITITGNTISSGETANISNTTHIYVNHFDNVNVSNNTVKNAKIGVEISGKSNGVNLVNNKIDVSSGGDAAIRIMPFINANYPNAQGVPQKVSVRNNVITSNRYGIQIDPASLRANVSGNTGRATLNLVTYPGHMWSADFEAGDFKEFSYVQGIRLNEGPGPQFVYVSDFLSQGVPARTGSTKIARFELPAGAPIHSKVFKEWSNVGKKDQFQRVEERLANDGNPSGTYESWYYFPKDYQVTNPNWTNIFQFKEEGYIGGVWHQDPSWWVNISAAQTWKVGGKEPVLFINHWNNDYNTFKPKVMKVPLGKWFKITANLYEKNRIDWYIDGKLFDRSYNASYPVGRFYEQSNGWIFGVGHYMGEGKVWIDDVSYHE